ncbi:ANKRD50, partial [Symbiodinium sp. KB8]
VQPSSLRSAEALCLLARGDQAFSLLLVLCPRNFLHRFELTFQDCDGQARVARAALPEDLQEIRSALLRGRQGSDFPSDAKELPTGSSPRPQQKAYPKTCHAASAPRVLSVLSGEVVANLPVEELTDVRNLKLLLHRLHGFPTRFRQRLLLGGNPMADSAKLEKSMDLELVLLNYSDLSQTQADYLVTAALNGFASEVEEMLHLPQNPDTTDVHGRNDNGITALIMASQRGHMEIVRMLLDTGAGENLLSNNGVTALMAASHIGHMEIVRMLLDTGAEENLVSNNGVTALMAASRYGHVEIVRMLLDAGAEANLEAYNGVSALILASRYGHVEIIRMLLDAGADLASNDGIAALISASRHGRVEVVRALLDGGADHDLRSDRGVTALMAASRRGQIEVVRLLLDAGAARNFTDNKGYTALMSACCKGHVKVVRMLLDAGADFNLVNKDGRTAIFLASQLGQTEALELLRCAAGADGISTNKRRLDIELTCSKRAAVQSSVPVAEAQTPPVPSAIRRALTPPPATTSQEAQTRISNLEQVVQELRGDLHRQRADAQRQEEKVESLSQIVRRLDAQVTLHPAPREELPSAAVASSVSPDFKELKQIMEQTLIELEMLSRLALGLTETPRAASMKHIQELRRRAAGVASRTDEGQVPAAINTQDLAFDDVSEATCFSPGRHADLLASSPTTLALQPDDGTCSPPRRLSGDSEMTCPPGSTGGCGEHDGGGAAAAAVVVAAAAAAA